MNIKKLAMIEKAKCVFSPYEIATPSVINTVNLMADFALEQTAELRDRVARLEKALTRVQLDLKSEICGGFVNDSPYARTGRIEAVRNAVLKALEPKDGEL